MSLRNKTRSNFFLREPAKPSSDLVFVLQEVKRLTTDLDRRFQAVASAFEVNDSGTSVVDPNGYSTAIRNLQVQTAALETKVAELESVDEVLQSDIDSLESSVTALASLLNTTISQVSQLYSMINLPPQTVEVTAATITQPYSTEVFLFDPVVPPGVTKFELSSHMAARVRIDDADDFPKDLQGPFIIFGSVSQTVEVRFVNLSSLAVTWPVCTIELRVMQ
jgi:hypothetical protein